MSTQPPASSARKSAGDQPYSPAAMAMPAGVRRSIITVFTDLGTKTVVPVTATRDENP